MNRFIINKSPRQSDSCRRFSFFTLVRNALNMPSNESTVAPITGSVLAVVALFICAAPARAQFPSQQDACAAGMEQAQQLDAAAWQLQSGIGYDMQMGRQDRACQKSQLALRLAYQSAQATSMCDLTTRINYQQAIETASDGVQSLCQGQ
jgi:hypothetical protein